MFSKILSIKATRCKSQITIKRLFYNSRSKYDTIFAPATTIQPGKGSPLALIRVSGRHSQDVLFKFTGYQTDSSRAIGKVAKPRYATVAKIYKPCTKDLIDMGMFIWFPKPYSYTGEDICEFHVHGSGAIMKTMLRSLGQISNLRPAEPGEFTRRAVTNNKMSLMQAEGLSDLIASQTEKQRKLALRGLDGSTLNKYNQWIDSLVNILAHLEASIDFGEDELLGEKEVVSRCIQQLMDLSRDLTTFLKIGDYRHQIINEGIRLAILGKPNVGKSTFMNLLCGVNKSIESPLSGTTRDVVEHKLELDDHSLTIYDTAGLREVNETATSLEASNSDPMKLHESIEQEGIRRALEKARNSSIVIYLIDSSQLTSDIASSSSKVKAELEATFLSIGSKVNFHIVINKIDLNSTLLEESFQKRLKGSLISERVSNVSLISCKTRKNFDEFVKEFSQDIHNLINNSEKQLNASSSLQEMNIELSYINERHISLLRIAKNHLDKASILDIRSIDEMAQHVRESVGYLSLIVGTISNEQVYDVIFRDFCIGK